MSGVSVLFWCVLFFSGSAEADGSWRFSVGTPIPTPTLTPTVGGAGKIKLLQEGLDRQTNQVSVLQEQVRKLEAELAHQAASNAQQAQQSSGSEQRLQEALQALQVKSRQVKNSTLFLGVSLSGHLGDLLGDLLGLDLTWFV